MRREELKRQYFLFLIVVAAVTAFVFAMVGLLDSYTQTRVEQRKDVYGGWHAGLYKVSEETYRNIRNHAIVDRVGEMTIYGSMIHQDTAVKYIIGSVDQEAKEIGRLALIDGVFPSQENEVAMEMQSLAALGYSYELGQEILLTFYCADKEGNTIVYQDTFVLTGVLHNYSDIWKKWGHSLVNIFISSDYSEKLSIQSRNLFVQAKEKYINHVSELWPLVDGGGSLIENDYAYYEYSEGLVWLADFFKEEILVFLVISFSVIILVILISTMIKQRQESFALIRSLGGERKQIISELMKEILPALFLGIFFGSLIGVLVPFVFLLCFQKLLGGFVYKVSIEHMGIVIIGILGGSLFACLAGLSGIFRVPIRGIIEYQSVGKGKKARKLENCLSFLTTFGLGCVFIISSYICYTVYRDYEYYKEIYPCDYKYGYLPIYGEPYTHISEDTLTAVKNTYGVERVRAYRISPYYRVDWAKRPESMYAEKLPAMQSPHLPEQKQSEKDIYACLYEIEIDDESGFADYLKLIEEGEITFEELQNSNKVIIYLPKLYEWKGEKIVAAKDYQYWLRKNSVITWKENTIEPGTLLTIEGEKGKVEVQVAAIIYSEAKESRVNPYMPLTLIGGEKLGKQLYDAADYACIEVYENPNVNSLQTEKELLEYNEGSSNFSNEKQAREKKFTGFLVQIVIVGIMNMIVITLLIIIKWGIADSRGYIDLRRNQLFYALGMPKAKIKWYYISKEIHAGILCTIV